MTRINLATNNGYIFVDGKLRAYQFISALVDFESGEVEYTCLLGGKHTTFTTESCPEVYADEHAFKQGAACASREYTYAAAIRAAFFYVSDNVNNGLSVPAFCIKDNEVQECYLPKKGFLFCEGKTTYVGSEKFYECREQALLFCDVIKVDENGEETTHLSPAKMVALDQEQMDAVKGVQEAIRKANELGVRFCLDNCDERVYAYSNKSVKRTDFDCISGCYICDFGYCINDLMTPANFDICAFSMDDTGMYVKFE